MSRRVKVDRSGRNDRWYENILILWEEDDAKPEGRETGIDALKRITGLTRTDSAIKEHDGGDWGAYLFRSGWVYGYSYDGGFVGVVVSIED